jgi:hypothetical protein
MNDKLKAKIWLDGGKCRVALVKDGKILFLLRGSYYGFDTPNRRGEWMLWAIIRTALTNRHNEKPLSSLWQPYLGFEASFSAVEPEVAA